MADHRNRNLRTTAGAKPAGPNLTVGVPTNYYKHEQSVPIPYPAEEWRSHYQSEKKKLSESWLQQLLWNTPIEGSEDSPRSRPTRKFHPFEAEKIKTNSPWEHWDSILQITGLRPGIDLKEVTIHLSRCRMMDHPPTCSIYKTCKKRLSRALERMCAESWADNSDRVIILPDQTELETIRILGESNQEVPRLGHFPSSVYKDLKTLGLAGMLADDQTNATALLCWRASLRAVGAKMGYHSLEKLKEDNNRRLPTTNEVAIDLDDYGRKQEELRGRPDALVADDRDQTKLKPKLEKSDTGEMNIKLEKSDTDTVEMGLEKSSTNDGRRELEKRNTDSVELEVEKSSTNSVDVKLWESDTILQSVEATDDERSESTSLQHGKNTGDRGQQPSQAGGWGRHHADIQPDLDLLDSSSTEESDSDDLFQSLDHILKYKESRIRHLESIIKKRKAKASHKGAKHKALTKRLQQTIKELSDKNSALEQALRNTGRGVDG